MEPAYPVNQDNIHNVLDELTRNGASDIQFKVGHPPLAYQQGVWNPQSQYEALVGDTVMHIHQKICRDDRYRTVPDSLPFDGDYRTSSSHHHFRVSVGKEQGRLFLSLRPLPRDVPDFERLRLLDDELGQPAGKGHLTAGFQYVLKQKRGLILVTGPTGSGKSTTLASFVDHVNQTRAYNIITIEDPIEFVFRSRKSHIIQREVGVDTTSFSDALRAALRQKPDIILVGEMRDAETINAAFRAAATGHLVLSTLHNNEAAQTIERIINEFPTNEQVRVRHQLSEVLVGIFAQQIVPTIQGSRQVIHEGMVITPNMRGIMRPRENEPGGAYLQTLRDTLEQNNPLGNRSMDSELRRAVAAGLIHEDVALEYATRPDAWDRSSQ